MTQRRARPWARSKHPRRAKLAGRPTGAPARRRAGDAGFTLVELVVTLLLVAIITPLAFGLIRNLLQQSTDVHDTMVGVQQDQVAGEALLQYLHGATVILAGSDATTLDASIDAGINASTQAPDTATLTAVLAEPTSPSLDATFTTSITPNGGAPSNVGTYDAVASTSVFSYFYNDTTLGATTSAPCSASASADLPTGLACTSAPTDPQLPAIVAVGIDVTFLAGPHVPIEGFAAVRPSNFETTVYLQNSAGVAAVASGTPTTTTSPGTPTTTTSPGTTTTVPTTTQVPQQSTRTVVAGPINATIGAPATVRATVSPSPGGGTVSFVLTLDGGAISCGSGPAAVGADGTATCSFTPAQAGTYSLSADYSGDAQYGASSSTEIRFTVSSPTTLELGVVGSNSGSGYWYGFGSGSLAMTATISPASATGSVTFTWGASFSGRCYYGYGSSQSVVVSSGSASYTATGLRGSASYCVSATFSDPTGTYGSSSAQATGTT
jgi:prepilin-type N-terminal cleavage/methylation domain-containing protein